MGDTVTTQVLHNDKKKYIAKFTNNSDGTGETNIKKVDISSLVNIDGVAPTAVKIEKVEYSISLGMSVLIAFDHTANDTAGIFTGNGCRDDFDVGGVKDPGSTGGTGDILFSTISAAAGDTYDIKLHLKVS